MASILLATLPSLAPPHFLESVIAHATAHSSTRLVIVLFSRHFNVKDRSHTFAESQAVSHTRCWDIVQRILTFTYVQATKVAWQMNNVLMPIDVLLKGLNEDLDPTLGIGVDVCYRVSGGELAGCLSFPHTLKFIIILQIPSQFPCQNQSPYSANLTFLFLGITSKYQQQLAHLQVTTRGKMLFPPSTQSRHWAGHSTISMQGIKFYSQWRHGLQARSSSSESQACCFSQRLFDLIYTHISNKMTPYSNQRPTNTS